MAHRLRQLVAVVVTVAFTASASAQGLEDPVVALEEGARAPFSGMLFQTETAVRWRQRIEMLQERLRLDVERCESVARVREEAATQVLDARLDEAAANERILREALAEATSTSWYEDARLMFTGGVVFGLLSAVLVTALVLK